MTPMRERAAQIAFKRSLREFDSGNVARLAGRDGIAECRQASGEACAEVAREIRALPDDPNPTRSALEECVRAAKALVAKIDELTPAVNGVFQMAAIHGSRWPADKNWIAEMATLKAALEKADASRDE